MRGNYYNEHYANFRKKNQEEKDGEEDLEIITSEWDTYEYLDEEAYASDDFWDEDWEEDELEIPEETGPIAGRGLAIVVLLFFVLMVMASLLNTLAGFPLGAYLESRELEDDPRVEQMRAGVVSVSVWEDQEMRSFNRERTGTGFNVDPSGIILTNKHVVEGSSAITISFRHQEETQNFRVSDWEGSPYPGVDLAMLSIESEEESEATLPYVPVAENPSTAVSQGDTVLIIGNPRGVGGLAVEGEILQKHELSAAPHVIIEIDASIHPGHSGSPVITEEGEVVGIIYASRETGEEKRVGLALSLENYQQIEKWQAD